MGVAWRQGRNGWACGIRVGKNLIDIAKVECRGILTVRPKVLDGDGKECSDCRRE